jgi:cobyrinic acid a,c-diamide synthase
MRDIPLLGTLAQQAVGLPERHLGLVPPHEVEGLEQTLDALADSLDLDEAAWRAMAPTPVQSGATENQPPSGLLRGRVIAIARDAAFAFLYPANVKWFEALGASVVWFSPLADEAVPDAADAVYLPGGYPELHAQAPSKARCWVASIRDVHARGIPVYAECGGMMVLAESLQDIDGRAWPMAGLLEGAVKMQSRLAAIGPQAWVTQHGDLRGHTFHHSVFETPLQPVARTRKHPSGVEGEAVYRSGTLTASYFHAYFGSCPAAVVEVFSPSGLC